MSIKKKVKNYNVLIEEGLRTRQMYPTDILKVDNTDSTDSLWMPQDNANYGTLYASENGIYIAARDGYDAYSEVDVRVTFDDFSDLDLDSLDDTFDLDSLKDLDIDEFNDLFNNEDLWDDPFDKIDSSFDDRVKGIDPVSGNEYAVGLDANGYLDEYLLPSKIKIVKIPNKTTYLHNEKIDYTGIVVMAFTEDDKVWKNEQYPEGVIPFDELIFPVEIADALEAENIKYAKSDLDTTPIIQPIPFATKEIKQGGFTDLSSSENISMDEYIAPIEELNEGWEKQAATGMIGEFTYQEGVHSGQRKWWIFASDSQNTDMALVKEYHRYYRNYELYRETNTTRRVDPLWQYTHNGKTVYYCYIFGITYTDSEGYMTPHVNIDGDEVIYNKQTPELDKLAWTIIYGEITGGVQSIPVQWKRPDGEILEDSFFINVAFPNETLPDDDWNIIDPTINPHDIPETPEGEVTPEVEVTP